MQTPYEVKSWREKNIKERWEKRLAVTSNVADEVSSGVLVLKSEFNTAWNWFNARELGETVTNYWREWYTLAVSGDLNRIADKDYPVWLGRVADLKDLQPELTIPVMGPLGVEYECPDLRKIGMFDSRWLVSRSRTRNLFDLTSHWKQTVLSRLDAVVADPEEPEILVDPLDHNHDQLDAMLEPAMAAIPSEDDDNIIVLHHRRHPSPDRNLWM
ncbi:hypothetical protein CERSUDRAFT_101163 [Gelatoporia subvermispora B]|uniref:Uncharacterized protein n=1 Tax=Ceriporiopsis subvermispora (strain B) TaxID=914234 RepID=M2Q1D1_CERS8|nr:hypothetical protein CERSUDRAFT_101362 [Gelatoporia subvermispora B]EMD30618.1 hypothetical protein CERSUDRAFT_101163 [Gelatoporia subvermispora B]